MQVFELATKQRVTEILVTVTYESRETKINHKHIRISGKAAEQLRLYQVIGPDYAVLSGESRIGYLFWDNYAIEIRIWSLPKGMFRFSAECRGFVRSREQDW